MIQVLRPSERPKSPSEAFLEGIGAGIGPAVGKFFSDRSQRQEATQRNEALKKLTGMDMSGIPPEMQQAYALELLKQGGASKQQAADLEKALQLQRLKDEASREKRLQQQDLLSGMFGGGKPESSQQRLGLGQAQADIQGQEHEMDLTSNAPQTQIGPAAWSDEAIARVTVENPALGREMRAAKDAAIKENIQTKKMQREDIANQRKEDIEFHKETQKFDEDLIKQTHIAKKQRETVKDLRKNIKNIKPGSVANIFKGLGPLGNKVAEAYLSKDEAALQASIPQLLEGWKEIFGVRLSDADLQLLQDKLPSIGKSPEANEAIFKILEKYADMTTLRGEIARNIKKSNKGIRPLGYADMIEERFDEMVSPVSIVNPNTGNIIQIPAYKVSEAIKAGAKLANE